MKNEEYTLKDLPRALYSALLEANKTYPMKIGGNHTIGDREFLDPNSVVAQREKEKTRVNLIIKKLTLYGYRISDNNKEQVFNLIDAAIMKRTSEDHGLEVKISLGIMAIVYGIARLFCDAEDKNSPIVIAGSVAICLTYLSKALGFVKDYYQKKLENSMNDVGEKILQQKLVSFSGKGPSFADVVNRNPTSPANNINNQAFLK